MSVVNLTSQFWAIWPSVTTVREIVIPPATARISCCIDVHCVSKRIPPNHQR